MLFGCPRQNMNHSSENLKVIYTKCSIFYAIIINYQFQTSEHKNEEKLVKKTVQALKSYKNRLGMCIFVKCVKIINYIPSKWSLKILCGPWKVLEKSLKNGCNFFYEPALIIHTVSQSVSQTVCPSVYQILI